jgi:hypothetical protein
VTSETTRRFEGVADLHERPAEPVLALSFVDAPEPVPPGVPLDQFEGYGFEP